MVECFEEDDAFAAEAAGEEDEDFAGCEGRAGFEGVCCFACLLVIAVSIGS